MKLLLMADQSRIIRALGLFLCKEGKHSGSDASVPAMIVESVVTQPWSSLTFAGERHRVVVRLSDGATPAVPEQLDVPHAIVAVTDAVWRREGEASRLTLDLLAIAVAR